MSIDKQPDALKSAPAEGLTQALEAKINAFKYDREAFLKTATNSINDGGYSLTKSEITGKYDATEDRVTEAQVKKYFDGKGSEFCKDLFEQAKAALLKDYSKNIKEYYKAYVEKVKKAENDRKLTGRKMTKEETEEDDRNTHALFEGGHTDFSQLTLEEAIKHNVFPRFTDTTIIAQALSIADNENRSQRQEAILLKDIDSAKAAAQAESARCRVDISAKTAKKFKTVHRKEGYRIGKADVTEADKKSMPKIDTSLEKVIVAGASTLAYNPNTQKDWAKFSKLAKEYNSLVASCRIDNKFPGMGTSKYGDVMGVLDLLDRLPSKLDPVKFKEKIDARASKEVVYGAGGVLNMLMALQRAMAEMSLQEARIKEAYKNNPKELDAALKQLKSKTLIQLRLVKGNNPKARFSQLDVEVLKDEGKAVEQAPTKPAPIPMQGKMPTESQETKKNLLDQFSDEIAKVVPEVEKYTGVKIAQSTTQDGFVRATRFSGEYKAAQKQFLNVTLAGGKLMLRPNQGKGPDDYTDLKEAIAAAKDRLIKRAESLKTERDTQLQKNYEASKEAAKAQWYKDFDKFLEENRDDFMDVPSIKVRKEMGAKNSYAEGKETISITHDYVITVGAPVNIDMLVVPVVEEGKVRLWARVDNKEKTGMTMRPLSMNINFKKPNQFAIDTRAKAAEFKAMEGAPKPLPPLPKEPVVQQSAPKVAPSVGLPTPPTQDKAPAATAGKPAAAPEAQKPLTEGLSAESPKDFEEAKKQTREVFNKLVLAGRKEAWGGVDSAFRLTMDIPGFVQLNYSISAEPSDQNASDTISKKPHFKIKQGTTETMAISQKELMQRIETILGKK